MPLFISLHCIQYKVAIKSLEDTTKNNATVHLHTLYAIKVDIMSLEDTTKHNATVHLTTLFTM